MDARVPVLLLALLAPNVAALPGPAPLAPPEAPPLPPLPPLLPLALSVPAAAEPLVVGVRVEVPVLVASTGLAGSGMQPPAERRVALEAALGSGDPAVLEPNPVALPPGAAEAVATLRFTPTRLGALPILVEARWETVPGNASLAWEREVVKDDLAVEGLAAGAPDADLDLGLAATLRSGHLAAEPLAWRVEAEHTPANGSEPLRWTAASGAGMASPGGAAWNATVRARYGPGAYHFTLHAGGARLEDAAASVAVDVPDVRADRASVNYTLVVEDHATTLRLASDSVNADGKAKRPGDALVTRVLVGDLNGLGDVRRVTFAYARDAPEGPVAVHTRVLEGFGEGLERALEDRFDLSPMKDASYVCTITAEGTGAPSVQRTFAITDVQPEADLALAQSAFLPKQAGTLQGTLRLRDANFGTGPLDGSDVAELGAFQLLLYKGSTRVAESGWALAAAGAEGPAPLGLDLSSQGSRSTAHDYSVAQGKGQLELPVEVRIPEGAAAGAYRLTVADDASLASAPFNVTALPRIAKLSVQGMASPGGSVQVLAEASPVHDATALELRASWGLTARAARAELVEAEGAWHWNVTLPLPSPMDDEAPAELTVVADLGDGRVVRTPAGAPVNARTIPLAVANAPPSLEAGLRVAGVAVGEEAWLHPHAALELTAHATARDANAVAPDLRDELGSLSAEVRDWTGALAPFEVDGDFAPAGAALQVQPLDAEPGRYTLLVRARDDDNAVAERPLTIHVGTHFRLGLDAPEEGLVFAAGPDGALHASMLVRSRGNAPAGSIAVLAEGLPPGAPGEASLQLANGTLLHAPLRGGFARFEAPRLLEPWEWATLGLRVDASHGVAAGRYEGRIVVAGEAA